MHKIPIVLLYVEDDRDIAEEIEAFLSRVVSKVVYAQDGEEAYSLYKKEKIDMLLTDIQMPKMNGLELISKIRKQDRSIPILITTAYNDTAFLLESINLGVDGYLLKPLDLEIMKEKIVKAAEPLLMYRRIVELNERLIEMNAELEVKIAHAVKKNIKNLEMENSKIKQLAFYDDLTGIANRTLIYTLLEKEISKAERNKSRFALFFIDLDDFKKVNDTYGHYVGDQVLIEVARRVKSVIRESDSLGRLGGDEFLLIASDVADIYAVRSLAEKIFSVLAKEIVVDEIYSILVSCSIGISCFPDDAKSMDEMIKNADKAMYKVKKETKHGIAFANNGEIF